MCKILNWAGLTSENDLQRGLAAVFETSSTHKNASLVQTQIGAEWKLVIP